MLYRISLRMRRIIETKSSQLEEFGAKLIRAVSRRSLAVKIIPNIYQMVERNLMGTRVEENT